MTKHFILIPAYQPDERLIELITDLKKLEFERILIINDGSDSTYDSIFLQATSFGCEIITHDSNLGKGAAIKTGIRAGYELFLDAQGCITCDADGQHLPDDIKKVSDMLLEHDHELILGTRQLSKKNTPKMNRFGNWFSSVYFKSITGIACPDTQTGLRGIPKSLNAIALSIPFNRYDYEMEFLFQAARENKHLVMIPIETVYLDENASSHFRPIVDSIRIYKQPIRFLIVSVSSAILDLSIFTLLVFLLKTSIFDVILIGTLVARLISGMFNFMLNRIWSFQSFSPIRKQFIKYLALYVTIFGLSVLFVYLLSFISVHLTMIKIFVDGTLFMLSYVIQKIWVFRNQTKEKASYRNFSKINNLD